MFDLLVSFTPDVPSSYIDYCVTKGYEPGREKRPWGMYKIHPTCSAPFEGTYKELTAFRKGLEQSFKERNCNITRLRLSSRVTDAPLLEPAPLMYLETVITNPVHPLKVDASELMNLISFMRDRNSGVYQDIMCTRDDRKETWRAVVRGPLSALALTEDSNKVVEDARKFLRVSNVLVRRIHTDNNQAMDKGWIK